MHLLSLSPPSPLHLPHTEEPQHSPSTLQLYRPPSTRPGPMELGEILLLIAPWLLSNDIFSCTLVSTYWHSVFNPLLWKNIAISEGQHKPDHLPYLAKHIKSVQSLQWEYTEWWVLHHVTRAPAPHPQLQPRPHPQPGPTLPPHRSSLVPAPGYYPGRPVYNLPTSISFPTTATLQLLHLHEATQLEALALDGPFELLPLIRTLTGSTQQLRRLTLKNTNCMRRETLDISLLLQISPCLEHLSIRTHALVSAQEGTPPSPSTPGLLIKSLDLDIRSLTGRDLIAVIAQCPQLDKISWTDYGTPGGGGGGRGGGGALRETYPMNSKFIPVGPNTLMPPVAHLPLPRLCFGDAGLMALSQFSTRLTSLDIGQASAGKIQSRAVQAFLQQCTTLLHLRVRGCIQVVDMVNARYLLSPTFESVSSDAPARLVPWACTALQTLSVAFSISELASPLPFTQMTNANNIIPSAVDTHDMFEKLQQQHHHQAWAESIVFAQLSLLPKLRTLEIKSSFMRLTLGTGFELLSSLTDLRDFSMTGPNIGGGPQGHPTPSLPNLFNVTIDEWFTKHWAHVESIQVASRDRPKGFSLLPMTLHNIPQQCPFPASPIF